MENNRLEHFLILCKLEFIFREHNILIIRFNPNLIHANFNLKLPDIQESKNFANRKQFQFTNFYFSDLSSLPNFPHTNFPNYAGNIWALVRSVNFTIHNFSFRSWPLYVTHLQGYLPSSLALVTGQPGVVIGVTTADLMTSGSELVKNWAPSNILYKLRTFAKIRWNWKFFWMFNKRSIDHPQLCYCIFYEDGFRLYGNKALW